MEVHAVVPLKALSRAKTRLSPILSPRERQILSLKMLEDVLYALTSSNNVNRIVLISPDTMIKQHFKNYDVKFLTERSSGLNQAVEQATEWCVNNGAGSVLVSLADIPLLCAADLDELVKLKKDSCVVICPSVNGGTNLLLRSPPEIIPTKYGAQSFGKHLREAYDRNVAVGVFWSPHMAFDIDTPRHLKRFVKQVYDTHSFRFLQERNVLDRFLALRELQT